MEATTKIKAIPDFRMDGLINGTWQEPVADNDQGADNRVDDLLKIVDDFADESKALFAPIPHEDIFAKLLSYAEQINFKNIVFPESKKLEEELMQIDEGTEITPEMMLRHNALTGKLEKMKLQTKHYVVTAISEVIALAVKNSWAMCLNNGSVYLFNNAYWKIIEKEGLQKLFGEIAEKLGVPKYDARYYQFREALLKQFFATAYFPRPKVKGNVLMNFLNGTLEIATDKQLLRSPSPDDFLTYQLPFKYDPNALAPLWTKFLKQVLPDESRQLVLAEYMASAFITNRTLKLEKALLIYGTGSNGKGVFYEVSVALFGKENVSNYSLESLTDESGYYRAKIANTLINYSSENGEKMDANFFKQLASGEDVPARLPYGEPFQVSDYAKLIFNTNKLPKQGVEQTHAFYRRFLIIHFGVTISEQDADKELHLKIIKHELPGVFNWVMDGLKRLLSQKGFTYCQDAVNQVEEYKVQSDSVRSFLYDENWEKTTDGTGVFMNDLYIKYTFYCTRSGLRQVSIKEFSSRFKEAGHETKRTNAGMKAFIAQSLPGDTPPF